MADETCSREGSRGRPQVRKPSDSCINRAKELTRDAIDITPTDGKFPWTKAKNLDDFEENFSFKPVKIRGYLATIEETRVRKVVNGEKVFEIICPLYTHLNESGEKCGILVNRGVLSRDFHNQNRHRHPTEEPIYGILYRGDSKHKYSVPNAPIISHF